MSDDEGELYERKKTKDTVGGAGFIMPVGGMQPDGSEAGYSEG